MDLGLLLNTAFVGGIIGILQGIKALDTKGKLAAGFYILAAIALGFFSGFILTPYAAPFIQWVQKSLVAGVTYAGASSILYQTGKLIIVPHVDGIAAKFINKPALTNSPTPDATPTGVDSTEGK